MCLQATTPHQGRILHRIRRQTVGPKKTNSETFLPLLILMSTDENLIASIQKILIERSKRSIELSKQAVIAEKIDYEPLREALRYFMEEIWVDASHPALLSLACEAVGGNPGQTDEIGAALVLLAGAADIHDDIIDQSDIKDSKQTIFGKYGKDIAIIAGDVLWFKGMLMMSQSCEALSSKKRDSILNLAKQAFFDIGSAEAHEAHLRGNLNISPGEYLDIIKHKVSVAAVAAQIGAILGDGDPARIEGLKEYGKTLGILMTIRDEFVDMFELEELKNRYKNECLPLPMLYAFRDASLKSQILAKLEQGQMTETELEKLLELIVNSDEVHELVREMETSIQKTSAELTFITKNREIFVNLLKSSIEDLLT